MLKNILIILFITISIYTISTQETHIVQSGETLYQISKKYNISVDDIITLNSISDISNLSIGTVLKLNEEDKKRDKISAKNYIVKKGDTLFSISRKFNLPLSLLMEYNNLNAGDIITLGQVLNVSKTFEDEPVKIDNSGIDVVKTASPSSFAPYWPINGNITKYSGRIQGVQIEGSSGDYIQAVSSGRVIWYDSFKGIGKVVLIEGDNGFDYLYGAKDDLNVHLGVKISAGEKIGRLKEENSSIIFSVFKNGKPLNDISKAPR